MFNINIKKNRLDNDYPSYLWKCRLGQLNEKTITKLNKEWYCDTFDYESYKTCKVCLLCKMNKTLFIEKSERPKELLGPIHINICELMMIHVIYKYTYFITFIHDHSIYCFVYLIKHKSKLIERFKEFRSKVKNKWERVLWYFNLIKMVNTWVNVFTIIKKNMRLSHKENLLEHLIRYSVVHDELCKPFILFIGLFVTSYCLLFK